MRDQIEKINSAIDLLESQMLTNPESDVAEMASASIALKRLTNRLKDLESHLHSLISPHLEFSTATHFDGGSLEKKSGTPRKAWDHPALKAVAVEKIIQQAVDPDTGAVDAPLSALIGRAFDVVGINYWKVGELKKLGINPDRYCTTEPANVNVITRLS